MSISNDTKVLLNDQNAYTFPQLVLKQANDLPIYGFGVTKEGLVVETFLTRPRHVKDTPVFEFQLSTGEVVHCSGDTYFYLRLDVPIAASELHTYDKPLVQFGGEIEIQNIVALEGLWSTYTLTSSKTGNYLLSCGLLVQAD